MNYLCGVTMKIWVKRLIKIFSAVVVLLIVLVCLVPTLLSVSTVQRFLLSQVNQKIPGKIQVAGLQLGWTTGIDLQGLEVKDPQGRTAFSCKRILLQDSLFSLLHSPLSFGPLLIDSPKCVLIEEKNGSFSLENAFSKEGAEKKKQVKKESEKKESTNSSLVVPFVANMAIENGELLLSKPDLQDVQIADLFCKISIQGTKEAHVTLTADIIKDKKNMQAAQKGTLTVDAHAKEYQSLVQFYEAKLLSPDEKVTSFSSPAEMTVVASLTQFPIDLADSLATLSDHKLKGLIPAALGETLDLNISHTLKDNKIELKLAAQSQKLFLQLEAETNDKNLLIRKPALLRWQVDPLLLEVAQGMVPQLKGFELSKSSSIELALKPTTLPLPLTAISEKLPLSISFGTQAPFFFKNKSWGKEKELSLSLSGTFDAASVYEAFDSELRLQAVSGINSAQINAKLHAEKLFSSDAKVVSQLSLQGNLPPLATLFSEEAKLLQDLLGRDLNVQLACEVTKPFSKEPEVVGTTEIQSAALKQQASFAVKNGTLEISPFSCSYLMMPDRFQTLVKKGQIALISPMKLKIESAKIVVPFVNVEEAVAAFKISCEPVDIKGIGQFEAVQIKKFELDLLKDKKNFELTTNIFVLLQNSLQSASNLIGKELSVAVQQKLKFEPNDLKNVQVIKGKADTDLAIAIDGKLQGSYNLALPFEANLQKNEAKASCELLCKDTVDNTKLNAQFFVTNKPASEVTLKSTGTFEKLPVKILAEILKNDELVTFVGNFLSGSWKVDFQGMQANNNQAFFQVDGKELQIAFDLNMGNGCLSQTKSNPPFIFKMNITKERFEALLKALKLNKGVKQELLLKEAFPIEFACTSLKVPLQLLQGEANLGSALDGVDFATSLQVGKLTFTTLDNKSYVIPSLVGSAEVIKGKRQVTFELQNNKGKAVAQGDQEAYIFLKGMMQNLWDDKGINLKEANIEIESRLQQLPLDILEHISSTKEMGEKLATVVGPKLNAELKAKLIKMKEGEIQATVKGAHLQSEISSSVKQGKLYLNKPCTVRLEVTPKAGKVLFKDVNPLLASGVKTDHPIEVLIDNRDFVLPMQPFTKQGIQIKKVTVNLGKLQVKKGGAMDIVCALLNLSSSKEMDLWFTPLFLEVRNGVVYCSRVDALLDQTIQIASWGTIDLVSDKVDMVVGVFGDGLRRSLRLEGLDPNYVLQLPLKGTTSTATIDRTRATAKIASLRLREANNPTQALIGGLLGLAAHVGEQEAPVPPPTTSPFPWQTRR